MSDPIPPTPADDRPHRAADDREEIYYAGSPLLRGEVGMVLGWGVAGLVLLAAPVLIWAMQWPVPWWVTIAPAILGIAVLIAPAVILSTINYRISIYRIDYERGIFVKRIDTLELWHVDDISFRQSLIQRLLRVGTITIISDDPTTPNLVLRSLPKPRPLFDALKQRVISVKRQRGVIKMDIG